MALRIVQVSDTHLSERSPEAIDNFRRLVDVIAADPPDLVVNTGDVSLNGADDLDDLVVARQLHELLPVPWRVVAGNHDVGDIGDDADQPADEARRTRFGAVFGESEWMHEVGGWRLVGFDVQRLHAEPGDEVWSWLEETLAVDAPTAVFTHRPLAPGAGDEFQDPHLYVVGEARERLRRMYARPNVRLVGSGHVHQWRRLDVDGTLHVWAPSAWAAFADHIQPPIGDKVVGAVELVLDAATDAVEVDVIRPPGVAQHVLGETLPFPYAP